MSVPRDAADMTAETEFDATAQGSGRDAHKGMSTGPEVHHSGLSIIASKISPASPGRSVLSRPRLVDWMLNQARARVIVVSAEAGYGKTTLFNEFALQTRDSCVWYRLESSDGDWITFVSYLVAAFRDVWPGFGRSTEALLRNVAAMGSTQEVVLAQFLSDLGDVEDRRVAVILDDYHLVEESPDVRMILSRMLERAPAGMYFILGGRGVPNLALGRLAGQGRVSDLNIDDLRFSAVETERLFQCHGQPLDPETCRMITERTGGWAASLQLVAASIAVRQPSEVANFIEALSGATGPIYDFLAEEVLTRLSQQTQRMLTYASLVDQVRTRYVTAALLAAGEAVDAEAVERAIEEADALGLITDGGPTSDGLRIQALFRDFLQVHLQRITTPTQIREMHRAVARVAEADDWLMAAKHYAAGEEEAETLRVLGTAAGDALGTGAWGAAVAILEPLPTSAAPPAVKVIQARALISDEHIDDALALLKTIDRSELSAEERALVGLTFATVHHMGGSRRELTAEVEAIAADPGVPEPLHEVAVSWKHILDAMSGDSIETAARALQRMEVGQKGAGLHYFHSITLHNRANAELAMGNYERARALARAAVEQLSRGEDVAAISASTLATEAAAVAEMGHIEDGLRLANSSATGPDATADAIADAAFLHAAAGRARRASALLAQFDRRDSRWAREIGSDTQGEFARIALLMARGDLNSATEVAQELVRFEHQTIDDLSRQAVVVATLATARRDPRARALARRALDVCGAQKSWRWMARARLIDAAACRDGEALANWIEETENDSAVALLELADAVATAIGTLVPLPAALERSILREPDRWLRALGRQVAEPAGDDAAAAASLLARFGTADDAELLRQFDRNGANSKSRRPSFAARLVRRVSPVVRVHDLGLSSFEVGDRRVVLAETRRKSAALLLHLVTRTNLAATRDLVMETHWPDQTPKSALNSLHQTIFYLRRDIAPWFEDGLTAEYVRTEGELVRLDSDLFQIDSVAFSRQATEVLARGTAASHGPAMLDLYAGQFAPEFEYEEWALEWRTHLHATYLRLAHITAAALVSEGRHGEVVDLLGTVVTIDPTAYELRATLVGCLSAVGASDAAQAQYRSLLSAYRRDRGDAYASFEEVVGPFRR